MFMEKVAIYLKLISEATLMQGNNEGTLRKDIWDYLLKIYNQDEATVDYRDFLLSIRHLLQQGKLLNEQGYFRIEPNTFREIWEKPATPDFSKRALSSKPNPLLSDRKAVTAQNSVEQMAPNKRGQLVQKNLLGGIANPFTQSFRRCGKSQTNLGLQAG